MHYFYSSICHKFQNNKRNISYTLAEQLGPDHDKTFKMNVFVGEEIIGTGIGKSKKEAEQKPARDALKKAN